LPFVETIYIHSKVWSAPLNQKHIAFIGDRRELRFQAQGANLGWLMVVYPCGVFQFFSDIVLRTIVAFQGKMYDTLLCQG
jgi:hypothetical protein